MHFSKDQSLIAVYTETVRVHDHEIRPVQFLELAVLYKLFGLDPLGYHLANSTILLLDFCYFIYSYALSASGVS